MSEDLREMGTRLRERREALDLTRDELSRRVGVTPAYIFMVESARPRRGGAPSRPKRETLKRWAEALGMEEPVASDILRLAGYYPIDPDIERHLEAVREMGPAQMAHRDMLTAAAPPPPATYGAPAAMPVSSEQQALHSQLDATLQQAARSGRWDETVQALKRLLSRVAKDAGK